jgi:hypothetical protein
MGGKVHDIDRAQSIAFKAAFAAIPIHVMDVVLALRSGAQQSTNSQSGTSSMTGAISLYVGRTAR